MIKNGKIAVGKCCDTECCIVPKMANRHGLIAGATGTGKTVTMKVIAESFSDMGVPVFFSDVKGDLSGTCLPGNDTEDMRSRIERFGIADEFGYRPYPTEFWDIFGEKGHPVRVTVSDMGPMLLARLFNLTEVQTGVLSIVFRVADDQGLELYDIKDLRAMLNYVGSNRTEYTLTYGNVSTVSIGAIQRALLEFENQGGASLFGEPSLKITDFIRTDCNGRGFINILESSRLIRSPRVYATFLLWMMTELFERLPEVGDPDKPRMVFFFDEAHLLFNDAPKTLVEKITQVVKLIRSKGVGIYFVTQSPSDVPDDVLAQLSNRVQHGLRAYTPAEQKSLRAAARAFRVNPEFDSEEALLSLGVGEALVSFLDESGVPSVVQKASVLPPQSLMGPASDEDVERCIISSEFELKYREMTDSDSAFEKLARAEKILQADKENGKEGKKEGKKKSGLFSFSKTAEKAASSAASSVAHSVSSNVVNSVTGGKTASTGTIAKRAATTALSSVMRNGAKTIIRGIFGTKK